MHAGPEARVVGNEQLTIDGFPDGGVELDTPEVADGGDVDVFSAITGDGDQPHSVLGIRAERLETDDEHIAQPRGEIAAVGVGEFLDEEGDAVAALKDLFHEVGVGRVREQRIEQLGDGRAIEPRHIDVSDLGQAIEIGEERPQRMSSVQLVGAIRGQEQDRCLVHCRGGNPSRSRVNVSAQWMSSITTISG